MELFNLEVSRWGISLETYFGDLYLYHRAWILILGVVVVLRLAKIIRKNNNKKISDTFVSDTDTDLWSN
jgi:hypothetical protein